MQFKAASLGFIIFVFSLTAIADESNQKNYGVSFDSFNGLYIRKVLNESAMIYAGIDLNNTQTSDSFGNSSGNSYSASIGARHYITSNQLSKFINLELLRGYSRFSYTGSDDSQATGTSANVSYGIEYFISPNVSIEGKAGISMHWSESSSASGTNLHRSTSFPTTNIAITYYW